MIRITGLHILDLQPDRQRLWCEWFVGQHVNPKDVPMGQDVEYDTRRRTLTLNVFLRDPTTGKRIIDDGDRYRRGRVTIDCTQEPPA